MIFLDLRALNLTSPSSFVGRFYGSWGKVMRAYLDKSAYVCAFVCALMAFIEYFITAEKLKTIEHNLRQFLIGRLKGIGNWLSKPKPERGFLAGLGVLLIRYGIYAMVIILISEWMGFREREGVLNEFGVPLALGIAIPFMGLFLFFGTIYLFIYGIRFLLWTPRGVLHGAVLPLLVFSTVYLFLKEIVGW